jgi:hypothetical protein
VLSGRIEGAGVDFVAVDDGLGMDFEKRFGVAGAVVFRHAFPGLVEGGGGALRVVGVAGEEADVGAEEAEEGLSGDLEEGTLMDPGFEAFRLLAEEPVAFRVGDDDAQAGVFELEEDLFGVGEDHQVRELDEEPAAAVDRVLGGMGDGVLDVVEFEVERRSWSCWRRT